MFEIGASVRNESRSLCNQSSQPKILSSLSDLSILAIDHGANECTNHCLFQAGCSNGTSSCHSPPKELTYSSVVTWHSVQNAFTIAALNDLGMLAVDVQNAYLNAPTKECCCMTASLEWGMSNLNQPILIIHVIYGLKSSAARWREHISLMFCDMGF